MGWTVTLTVQPEVCPHFLTSIGLLRSLTFMNTTPTTTLEMKRQNISRYITVLISVGAICLIMAAVNLPIRNVDVYLPILGILTVAVGSRITIRIPRFKSHVAVSDTFIFLVLMMYGGEFAVILSAIEAFASSWRFCNKKLTVFLNAAIVAISTTCVVGILKLAGLYTEGQLHGRQDNFTDFIIALSVMALTHFLVNTSLAAMHDSLKGDLPLWETWKSKYIWAFFSYFVGAIGAGVLIQLSDSAGIGVIFATFPIIFFVYLSYRMYMRNVENSIGQAEQAEKYASVLEAQAAKLRESEERFRSAFDHAPIGIGLVASSGKWLKVNHALINILGYSEDEFLNADFQSMTLPDDLGKALVNLHEIISKRSVRCQLEQRYIHKAGYVVWTSWSVSSVEDSSADESNLIFQIQDITDKKLADERLKHEATHDSLTGLPNRALFMNRLETALERTRSSSDRRTSILFIDLDRFKYVNDSLGHIVGDLLLKGIAERLKQCMRPQDTVARLGGDEFTILIEGPHDDEEVTKIADRIQAKFTVPFNLKGHEVYSSASIGILHSSDHHTTPEEMMRDADTAMYQAKRAGKARYETFDARMHKAASETLRLETDLRRAVSRDGISVVYQPIYSISGGRMTGVEALARWIHPEIGPISPTKFIPLAEELGLVDKLCENVMRKACRDIGTINANTPPDERLSMSVNLSCKQFAGNGLVESIFGILSETAFSPDKLKLEITESVIVEHADQAIAMLMRMRDLGIDIHIDDFGTGYSNLSYLMKLPISTLKIDRSFIGMVGRGDSSETVVAAIITLARNLGLQVIAEGIETHEQLDLLRRYECEGGQGYLFAKPMSYEEFVGFMSKTETEYSITPDIIIDDMPAIAVA